MSCHVIVMSCHVMTGSAGMTTKVPKKKEPLHYKRQMSLISANSTLSTTSPQHEASITFSRKGLHSPGKKIKYCCFRDTFKNVVDTRGGPFSQVITSTLALSSRKRKQSLIVTFFCTI